MQNQGVEDSGGGKGPGIRRVRVDAHRREGKAVTGPARTAARTTGLRRLPLFAGAALSLAAGMWGGLGLLGAEVPPPPVSFAAQHGPLMALGFLGTLISLERAVALALPWGYAAPALSALGAITVASGFDQPGRVLLTSAGGWLVAVYLVLLHRRLCRETAVEAAGALAWYVGGLLWLRGGEVLDIVPWLAAFLVLTIVGERLELARITLARRGTGAVVTALASLLGAGAVTSLLLPEVGWRVAGTAMLGLAAWLAVHDVARRTVRSRGLPRYTAVCLLAGYAWLAVAGVLWAVQGVPANGDGYDAALHALFLGFAVSMVFGHAPVILPAVLRVRLPYHPVLYGPLVLLHTALAARILGGLTGAAELRVAGGAVSGAALLVFALCAAGVSLHARSTTDVR